MSEQKVGLPAIDAGLEMAAREGTNYLIKALRGAIRMDEPENRALLGAATSAVGAYTRNRATTSAMQQTRLVQARMLADPVLGEGVAALLADSNGN